MTHKSSLKATYLLIVVLVSGFIIWPLASRALKFNDTPITVPFFADPANSDSGIYATIPPTLPRTFTLPTPLFAPDSAWNQTATTAAVLSTSDQQILVTYRVLRGDTTDLHPIGEPPATTWPFIDVGYDEFTIPVFRAGTGQASVRICDYDGNLGWPGHKFPPNEQLEGGPVTVPPPAGSVRPAMPLGAWSDGHVVLYDVDTFTEYDYWQATTVLDGECKSQGSGLIGSTIYETGAIDFFDVRGAGVNSDTFSSARATGPPLLAGLILPEDVESGAIEHALEFAFPGPRNLSVDPFDPLPSDYFYPASTTETDYYSTNPNTLAAGQRIRLKSQVVDENCDPINENDFAPITRMFLTALRTYGAYLVDNAGGFTFNAEEISTAVLDLTDDEINGLIDQSPGTPLPANKTRWQILMETLNEDLLEMPFACGPWTEGQDPATATITTANFEVIEPATVASFYLTTDPPSRAIDPGGVATYAINVKSSGGFTGTVNLVTSSPSPSLTLQLVPTSVDPPGQVTLIVTDSHSGPALFPGQWYTVPITATNGVTQTASVSLLVGGARLYLPLILKSFSSLPGLSAVNDF
ncbi:MAG: hypothetical protein V3S14_10975, partial [Anaerolineae bacterium]